MAEPIAPDAPEIPVHSGAAAMFTTDAVAHGEYSAVTRPEQIVVVGRPTLHRPVAKLLADPNIRVVVVTDTDTVTDVSGTAAAVTRAIKLTGKADQQWLSVCRAISDMGADAVRQALEGSEDFTAIHAVAAVADSLRDGDAVVLGASTTVRDASRAGLPLPGWRRWQIGELRVLMAPSPPPSAWLSRTEPANPMQCGLRALSL